jgi:hypothetical protein
MRYDDTTITEVFQELGTAYAVAKRLGLDHSSVAKRINRLGLRGVPANDGPRRHIVIPDVQAKVGCPIEYLGWVGQYIAEMEPDVVVQIGDFADMPSLSSYDKGKRCFEGRRYKKDIQHAVKAMDCLMDPIRAAAKQPELHLTLGNHEHRIVRATDEEPMLDGTIGLEDLRFAEYGWKVYPYLEPICVDGVAYAHYFTSGVMGRPVSSARALAAKKHQSCVMGHVQKVDMHRETRADGTPFWGLFSGCCYEHDEDYLGPQGNAYWRGIWVLNEVQDGDFQPMMVSLDYLRRTYGRKAA